MTVDPGRYEQLRRQMESEETRLRSIRVGMDPSQVDELERTRGLLRFWQSQVGSMEWNTEDENGGMIRIVDKPHNTVMQLVGFEDREISRAIGFPSTRREVLDMLQIQLMALEDRVEVNAVLPVRGIDRQLCTSTGQPTP